MTLLYFISRAVCHVCICVKLLVWNLLFYLIYNSCNAQIQHGIINNKACSFERYCREKSRSGEHDIDLKQLKQSRLVQTAMNQNNPDAISNIMPFLGAYPINKWYKTNQNHQKFKNRYTLLHWACEYGHLKIVEKLLNHKAFNPACLNLQDNLRDTPLHLAVKNAHGNFFVKNINGDTMDRAMMDLLIYRHRSDHQKSSLQNILGSKPQNNYLKIIQMLLHHPDIHVNKQDDNIRSPVHYAILSGDKFLINIFLNHPKIDLNAVDKNKSTLAHLLATRGDLKIFKFVFEHHDAQKILSKQLFEKDLDGHTPIDLAVIQFINATGPKLKKKTAASSGTLLKYLLKWTWERNIRHNLFKNGDALFHKVIEKAHLELFELLSYSTRPYVIQQLILRNNQGLTPLGFAIKKYGQNNLDLITQHKLEQIINILLNNYTIQVLSNDATNNNELHFAVILHSKHALSERQKKFLEQVAQKLMDISLDLVDRLNHTNETPLHIAIKANDRAMAKILLNYTDLTIQDRDANNALHLMANNLPILQLWLDDIKNGSIHFNNDFIKKTLFDVNNLQNQTPFKLLLHKVDNLALEHPEDPQVDQYMHCIHVLEPWHTDVTIIEKIKNQTIKPIKSTEKVQFDQKKCTICLEHLYPIKHILKIDRCGHHFHAWCLVSLCHYNNGSLHCPLCRNAI